MGNGTAGVLQHSPIHYTHVLIKIPNRNDAISVQHMMSAEGESFPSGAPHFYI